MRETIIILIFAIIIVLVVKHFDKDVCNEAKVTEYLYSQASLGGNLINTYQTDKGLYKAVWGLKVPSVVCYENSLP